MLPRSSEKLILRCHCQSLFLSFCSLKLPLSDHLDETMQRELPLQEELDIFKNDVHLQVGWSTIFCPFWELTVRREDADACQGDSGGPLVRVNPTSGRYEQVQLSSLLYLSPQNSIVNLHSTPIYFGEGEPNWMQRVSTKIYSSLMEWILILGGRRLLGNRVRQS